MKVYTRAQLVKRLIISCVVSAPFIVGFLFYGLTSDSSLLLEAVVGVVVLPVFFLGFLLNFKKILIGLIAPIPILSYLIEWFKGIVYAVKAVTVIFKHKDCLKIGSGEAEETQSVDEDDA